MIIYYWPATILLSLFIAMVALAYTKRFEPKNHASMIRMAESGNAYWFCAIVVGALIVTDGIFSILRAEVIQYEAEVASLITSWFYAHGEPLYHSLDNPERYSLLYGPMMYLPIAAIFKLGGQMAEARAFGFVGVMLSIIGMWLIVRKDERRSYLFLLGLLGLVLILAPIFTGRSDSWAFALVAFGAVAAGAGSLPLVALAAAIVASSKITAVLFFVPLATWVWMERGFSFKSFLMSVAIFFTVFMAPFILPRVSFEGFSMWIRAAGTHTLIPKVGLSNIGLFLATMLPAIWACCQARGWAGEDRKAFFGLLILLASGVLMAIPAAKVGAGYYHMVPFVPVMLLIMTKAKSWKIGTVLGTSQVFHMIFVLLGVMLISKQASVLWAGDGNTKISTAAIAELNAYTAQAGDPSKIAMGTGKVSSRQSNAVFYLMRQGGSYLFSDVVMWDMHSAGLPIPTETLKRIESCAIPYWAIPAGDEPFYSESLYKKQDYILEPVKEVFAKHYHKVAEGKSFDLWQCNAPVTE